MALFKCKMCGGSLEIESGTTVIECEYCGTQQTLPKLDDDKRANMYDRANHFRRNNDFDKAMGIYENILNEDNTDAEAYWSLVLCRYGIEYVEDPMSHKRIPTVNRAQFTSIFDDDNYKSALQYADSYQRTIYEAEAKAINEIQKGILAISQNEEPFDVFICYKETDNGGRRTPDSVLAQELYYQLIGEGFKVFFARITLEDKLGSAYEPYIFAALNSAKVMVVLGTKPEHFNAVWVKNEWSRYLSLIKNGAKKTLIPAYRNMDPYDLPEEFSHLQAQDMSKLGFMQDLIHGINKIATKDEPKATIIKETITTPTTANTAPLLERAFMFLEDGDWTSADEYCEKVLDQDPKNAQAYLGKLMAELKVTKQDSLKNCAEPFDHSNNYQKAIRFADEKLRTALIGYIEDINTRNENARLEGIYSKAIVAMNSAKSSTEYEDVAALFKSILDYKDSEILVAKCLENAEKARAEEIERAEITRKESIYNSAIALMSKPGGIINRFSTTNYEDAIKKFQIISGWRDSDKKIFLCQQKIEELKEQAKADRLEKERLAEIARQEEEARKKRIKKFSIVSLIVACTVIITVLVVQSMIKNGKYNDAIALMDAGKYTEAIAAFEALDGYKDSTRNIIKCYNVDVGDTFKFGEYEQNNDTTNKEKIEWLVLAKEDNKILVISKYALDCKPYNETKCDITWETCTLRQWLNNDFINTAFTADEKAIISTVVLTQDNNSSYSTNPGNPTSDKIFCLNITEANKYFSFDIARQCKPTKYAIKNGSNRGYTADTALYCWWWLRSPGDDQYRAAIVNCDGSVYVLGDIVSIDITSVRPAMWIELP